MKVQKINIENYKNIGILEIQCDGKNFVLRGKNGAGKTAVIEAVFKLLRGKGAVISDAVMHGQEEAKITVDIGNEKVDLSVQVKIKKDGDYSLKMATAMPNGKLSKYTAGVVEFVKGLFHEHSIDPLKFRNLSGKEQVKTIFDLMPELETEFKRIDNEKQSIQIARSVVKEGGERVKHELEKLAFTAGLPETEVDPVELIEELNKAKEHNGQLEELKEKLDQTISSISVYSDRISSSQSRIDRMKAQIKQIEESIAEEQKEYEQGKIRIDRSEVTKINLEKEISDFQEIPVAPIQEKINNLQATNQKVRDNQRHKELSAKIEKLREAYSKGLDDMRAKDQEKIDIIKSNKMPIDGLAIGDNCLLYPDPNTGELIDINNLSTGQSIPVCVSILAAFLPNENEGVRAMAVNLNELDEDNRAILMKAGEENNIQFIMHETVVSSDTGCVEVIITE